MRLATSCAAGAIVVATSLAAQPRQADGIQASWIAPHVRFLSDSTLQGRDTGSAEYQIAANYVASQFEMLGLKPGGDNGSYFQKLRVRKSAVVTGSASLILDDAAGQHALQFDREFLLHPSSIDTAMDVSAPLVFVGFSIVAPEAHYDDYAGVDARGKIVVFLPGPSAVQPVDVRGMRSTMAERAAAAKAHGAVGMIELLPGVDIDAAREHYVRQLDATQWLDDDGRPHSGFFGDVAFAMVTREGAAAMLRQFPQPLEQVREKLKAGPFSFPLNARATLRARFEHRDMTTVNVAAVRPGSDRSNEYVVYSAHLDHDGVSDYFTARSTTPAAPRPSWLTRARSWRRRRRIVPSCS
jgi:PA domain